MNINDTKSVLRSMITSRTPVTPMLWARHGIGKSSAVAQLGKELGYRVLNIILSQKEAVDLAGVLYTFEDADLGMSVTASHPPTWFADACKHGKLILFLDEVNMARREVMNAAFELILDRRLNNTRLPDDVFIVCAGNPEDDRYDVTPMSESLRDRFMHIHVTPDNATWLDWATTNVHKDVTNFIKLAPQAAYYKDEKDEAFPVEIKHSYRSWERVSLIHSLNLEAKLAFECYRGIVGIDLATAFVKMLNSSDAPLTAQQILDYSEDSQKRVTVMKTNVLRMDLLSVSVNNMVEWANKHQEEMLKECAGIIRFINDIPDDLAVQAINGIHKIPGVAALLLKDTVLKDKMTNINKAVSKK